jgi:hypothetical protein
MRRAPSLTAAELFSLYAALPERLPAEGAALERLRAWAGAHPALATRYPANRILSAVLPSRD